LTEPRMAPVLDFQPSARLSIGIELELQVLSAHDFNLVRGAPDLLDLMQRIRHPGELKPEMTEGMIELNSSIHEHYRPLLDELRTTRDLLAKQAGRLNIAISGGGTHAFHQWAEQRIFLSDLYGYLAKQFTVFGQHIHIGCPGGDEAVRLTHGLARYVPHFIALSASSPFSQGVDTAFQSARLNAVSAFPLGGQMPTVPDWRHFNLYFGRMYEYGIVDSMKDFYWDMRPKPEYGTVEIRVCDTPLQVERAAQLAAYAQTLAFHLLHIDKEPPPRDIHLLYNYNRFQACRFGLDGNMIDART
jgi:glutamate---cysteine ligase / carboxylate-amine ligase